MQEYGVINTLNFRNKLNQSIDSQDSPVYRNLRKVPEVRDSMVDFSKKKKVVLLSNSIDFGKRETKKESIFTKS